MERWGGIGSVAVSEARQHGALRCTAAVERDSKVQSPRPSVRRARKGARKRLAPDGHQEVLKEARQNGARL